jgi:hypothetical protein
VGIIERGTRGGVRWERDPRERAPMDRGTKERGESNGVGGAWMRWLWRELKMRLPGFEVRWIHPAWD